VLQAFKSDSSIVRETENSQDAKYMFSVQDEQKREESTADNFDLSAIEDAAICESDSDNSRPLKESNSPND
jgi:uncharacterized protein YkuJ